jgi:hypothetical protein
LEQVGVAQVVGDFVVGQGLDIAGEGNGHGFT